MKIKRGTIVQTDFGTGPVIAITEQWLIHKISDGREACVYIEDNWIGIPAEIDGVDLPDDKCLEIDG